MRNGVLEQFAVKLGGMEGCSMNVYSLHLRKKFLAAKEWGVTTSEVARTFGVASRR